MKRWLKSIVLLLVVAAMLVSLFGCGPAKSSNENGKTTANQASQVTDPKKMPFDYKAFEKFKGQKVSIWMWWDVSEEDKKKDQDFTTKTGVTIEYTNIPWDQFPQKAISAVAAGAGPDILWNDRGMPTWAYKKVLLPVSDYIDITKEPIASELGKAYIKYYTHVDGKIYSLAWPTNPYHLYYNKEKFEAAGLEDPLELWKAGQWNWAKFFEIGQALTQDTNGDGKIEQYGYDAWDGDAWFFSNGANYIKYVDGKPVFSLDDPAALAAMQANRDTSSKYKFRSPWNPDVDPQKKFLDGITCMDYWGDWDMQNFKDKLGDKLGIAPFPLGPDYKGDAKSADSVQSTGVGMAACTKNPELTATYIKYMFWPGAVKDPEGDKKWRDKQIKLYGSQEMWDFVKSWGNNGIINPVQGFGPEVDDLINKNILWRGDSTPSQLVNAAKPAVQAAIDNAIK